MYLCCPIKHGITESLWYVAGRYSFGSVERIMLKALATVSEYHGDIEHIGVNMENDIKDLSKSERTMSIDITY